MRQIIFHIGFHRTGSSALQLYLEKQRQALRQRQIALCLPADLRPGQYEGFSLKSGRARRRARLRSIIDAFDRSDASTLIISEENLAGPMPGTAPVVIGRRPLAYPNFRVFCTFAASLQLQFRIRISAVIRQQDEWLESLYAFHVYRGMTRGFKSFAARLDKHNLDWNRYSAALAQHGLLADATFMSHQAIRQSPIQAWASELLGLPSDLLAPVDHLSANISPTPNMLRLFYALNKIGWAADDLALRRRTRRALWQHMGAAPDTPLSVGEIVSALNACDLAFDHWSTRRIADHYKKMEKPTLECQKRQKLLKKYEAANQVFLTKNAIKREF